MREETCDVAILGAGTAGIAAHRAATGAGARAVLIEAGPGGTTCARVGCMPSKLLIAAARAAHDARNAGRFGVRAGPVAIDGPAVLERVRAERDRFVAGVFAGLDRLPAAARIAGRARFVGPDALIVGDHTRLRFGAAVIATGSSPSVPEPLRGLGERVLTTDTLFEAADLPRSLAVLGGGPVGIEMAQAMARLGVEVCLFDEGDRLGGLKDPALAALAVRLFGTGMGLHLGTTIEAAEPAGDGVGLRWTTKEGEAGSGVFARVLAATGRPPNVRGLGLDATGIARDARGGPVFDPRTLACAGAPILVAGDANPARPVLHEAARQGTVAGRNAAALAAGTALPEAGPPWTALAMVFTDPGIARVGEVDPEGGLVGTADLSDQGRARIMARNAGALRVHATAAGRLVGAEMIGPDVEHLAHILAFAVQDGESARTLHDKPFYHPTLEEGLKTALSGIVGRMGG